MVFIGLQFQGVRYALFSFHGGGGEGGFADFDSIDVKEPSPRCLTRPIPYGRHIELRPMACGKALGIACVGDSVVAQPDKAKAFTVVDRSLGRVALAGGGSFLSVGEHGAVSLHRGNPGLAETFQWIETFSGELTLMSLATHRYLRVDSGSRALLADSPGPEPNGPEGVRFDWSRGC